MDGTDMRRRMGWSRTAQATWARIAPLWQRQPHQQPVTAADCVKQGWEPERRLEPLRRAQARR
ncbi:hypothetical protein [Paracraurococcus lichenis]|uniref:Uncharacterized protein n=1 Tax=Paracraurococcus lichenis TaxID=3064888 RepID=A0ABT9DXE6_9PROT|nr:hypothetical protein [Paracraurococcus sp. LOR1-02]MDO9708568.1 hypothetical protein [Paracraurococcus sp. LOR1-02]